MVRALGLISECLAASLSVKHTVKQYAFTPDLESAQNSQKLDFENGIFRMAQQSAHETRGDLCSEVRQTPARGICEYSPDRANLLHVSFASPVGEDTERPAYGWRLMVNSIGGMTPDTLRP